MEQTLEELTKSFRENTTPKVLETTEEPATPVSFCSVEDANMMRNDSK